jgi:2-C-methyl-D-erythritol 4-phosphate cytidylyltransferase
MIYSKQKYAIIVAGGSGKRMGSDIPKQFIEIAEKPILMHTMKRFVEADKSIKLILVLPKNQHKYWYNLIDKYSFELEYILAEGGDERFYSVLNGLQYVEKNSFVAIHDGVRPLVSIDTINNCFKEVVEKKAVIPVVPIVESIRKVDGDKSIAVDRSSYCSVQTPQVFDTEVLLKAYKQPYSSLFTDDASVVEKIGQKIHLTKGNIENIKITQPVDLITAESILNTTHKHY